MSVSQCTYGNIFFWFVSRFMVINFQKRERSVRFSWCLVPLPIMNGVWKVMRLLTL